MTNDPKEQREFSDMSDNPTNTGWIGNEHDWEDTRTLRQKHPEIDDESEDCWDEDENGGIIFGGEG